MAGSGADGTKAKSARRGPRGKIKPKSLNGGPLMIYEARVYEVAPGRMPDLHDRFRRHTLRLFERHGLHPVGFFNTEIGVGSDRLTYLLRFDSLAHREKAWAAFLEDPEWQEVSALSNQPGQLVLRITSSILRPTDYFPPA
jgi:hypothetical protein